MGTLFRTSEQCHGRATGYLKIRQMSAEDGKDALARKAELNDQLKEYINEWRKTREKEEEELKKLKEKQAKRKEIRAEQEKKLNQAKKEEEKSRGKKKMKRKQRKLRKRRNALKKLKLSVKRCLNHKKHPKKALAVQRKLVEVQIMMLAEK